MNERGRSGLFKEREAKLGHCQQIRVSRVASSKVVVAGLPWMGGKRWVVYNVPHPHLNEICVCAEDAKKKMCVWEKEKERKKRGSRKGKRVKRLHWRTCNVLSVGARKSKKEKRWRKRRRGGETKRKGKKGKARTLFLLEKEKRKGEEWSFYALQRERKKYGGKALPSAWGWETERASRLCTTMALLVVGDEWGGRIERNRKK